MLDKLIRYSEKNRVFLHALMWTAYFLATILVNLIFRDHVQLFGILVVNLLLVAVFYALVSIFQCFKNGKYGLGSMLLALLFVAASGVAYACLYFFLPEMGVTMQHADVSFSTKEFLKNCSIGFYRMGFYAALYVLFLRFKESQQDLVYTLNQKLETEKMNVELERKERLAQQERDAYLARFLTAQIYPHFLRNTLNGLLGQATSHKDDDMVMTIQYLSATLEYSLKYSRRGKSLVYVLEEISFLENMISLLRIRAGSDRAVVYDKKGEAGENQIPPLSLLTFIENVFRYGLATVQHPLYIRIDHKPGRFDFQCRNVKKPNPPMETGSGIGLDNLQQRLSLCFKDRFQLEVDNAEETFTVSLTINYSI